MSGLAIVMPEAQMGICGRCWKGNAGEESCRTNPTGGHWNYAPLSHLGQHFGGCEVHRKAKAMYTAETRDWTYQPI